jgi:Rps23 Pro-64 3,4-dihydroxylase Tpa1-like proline 4-hydroxylase
VPESELARTQIVIFDEFLVAQEWRSLLDFTLSHATQFSATEVIGGNGESRLDHSYRRSRVIFDLGPFHSLFSDRLQTFLPQVLLRLPLAPFPVAHMEIQLTGTNHGEYFRVHADNDSDQVSGRTLTFVYFFHREPCHFSGGALRIYDTVYDNGHAKRLGPYRDVYPVQNQVVFFDSSCLHEILPLVSSGDFAACRFTVNGWFHR